MIMNPIGDRIASGWEEAGGSGIAPVLPEYPAGTPLTMDGTKEIRRHRPKILIGGKCL